MSSAPPVENFKGNSWEECDDFILAIHKRAFWEGKQRDSGWMADFAATNFSRKARLWHSRLPEDVRHDWSKLEIALLERWSPPEDDDEPQIEPNPAAAPLPNRSKTADRPLEGLLKVVLDESNTSYYVRFDDSVCNLTTDASEAIRLISGTILDNGEVVPVWTKDDTSETTLFVMTYGNFLYLVADPEAFARAKFFVEPTD
ncbi:hypothetical protein M407DRAFT_30775 [Tulasnella calospora MUT 4182]|uniref:Uncharacterized protein n=1 Tax=Tulasnella calospora MUT 4182 TaxID=1051891 RepID=A0A0C3Q7N5_9AGAM|nr:hypothetical protein M407DRAFT_30775 [Tulasnella calospora MUT 4182]